MPNEMAAIDTSSSVEQLVRAERVALLYRLTPLTLATAVVFSITVFLTLQDAVASRTLWLWLAANNAVSLIRYLDIRNYRRASPSPERTDHWLRRFLLLTFCAGALWGMMGTVLFPPGNVVPQAMIVVFLVGTASVALFTLSSSWTAYLTMVAPLMIPPAIFIIAMDEPASLVFGVGLLFYALVVFFNSKRTAGNVGEMLRLRFESGRIAIEREQALQAAEAASRAKSEFLSSMSHELRTPLNAILGFSQLFGMDHALSKETREQAREIEQAGRHLLALVNDLIDLARIESGKLEFSLEPVPVKPVLADSLAMVLPIARKQGIVLDQGVGAEDTATVRADYVRLRQVVINLLSNAIKYNRPGGTVRVSCHSEYGRVRIEVADTGFGIPADKRSRIFTAFDRLGAERGTVEGTGIGLVITKRMIEAMGGTIGFESAEGDGSSFWIELPLAETTGNAMAATSVAATGLKAAGAHGASTVVLYIEDNPINLRLMQRIFATRKDLELRDAHTAEIGIDLARTAPPALILMDINLPGMDGFEALAILRATPDTAHIPVIAVSANALKGDELRGIEAGFDAYLTKPINIPMLYRAIDHSLAKNGSTT